jgi:hypothetical protein
MKHFICISCTSNKVYCKWENLTDVIRITEGTAALFNVASDGRNLTIMLELMAAVQIGEVHRSRQPTVGKMTTLSGFGGDADSVLTTESNSNGRIENPYVELNSQSMVYPPWTADFDSVNREKLVWLNDQLKIVIIPTPWSKP